MATTTSTHERRKAGDTVILSGALTEATPIEPAAWTGAVAKMNIATDNDAATLVIDHAPVELDLTPLSDVPAGAVRYAYRGDAMDAGDYVYEVEVTFSDTTVLTWPNDATVHGLEIVPQLG